MNSTFAPVRQTAHSRRQAFDTAGGFGSVIADHMFCAGYTGGRWHSPEIIPYGDLSIAPAALGLHYGQTVFEGMKAFRMRDGSVSVFRIDRHYRRFVRSLERMCMPVLPEDYFTEGIRQLVALDQAWVPDATGASLYIRPFMIATEERFGIKVSDSYRFMIFTGPIGTYYSRPLRVKVETHYARAARGGTGAAKCGGNYGAALYPSELAKAEGFDQVLWTDSAQHEFIEESGMMNILFVIDGIVITPPLTDTLLDGVTRDSILRLAKDAGMKTQERKISCHEVRQALERGLPVEAFGAGTAAVTASISTIHMFGQDYDLPEPDGGGFAGYARERLTAIRTGLQPDIHHWNTIINL